MLHSLHFISNYLRFFHTFLSVKVSYVFVCLVHCLCVATREGVCPFAKVFVLFSPRWHNSTRRDLRCAVVVPREKRRASRRNSAMLPPRDQNRCTSLLLIRSHLPLSSLPPVATHLTLTSRERNTLFILQFAHYLHFILHEVCSCAIHLFGSMNYDEFTTHSEKRVIRYVTRLYSIGNCTKSPSFTFLFAFFQL